jgi:FtsZ-binding cell division protein ZapB
VEQYVITPIPMCSYMYFRKQQQQQQTPRDKYFNHKIPQRPDVTKLADERGPSDPKMARLEKSHHHRRSHHHKERNRGDTGSDGRGAGGGGAAGEATSSDTDHLAEITQLKEKIASLQKIIQNKNGELLSKQAEITQMKAKLFNEENLIKEKMRKIQKDTDDKLGFLQLKIKELTSDNAKLRRDVAKTPRYLLQDEHNHLQDDEEFH